MQGKKFSKKIVALVFVLTVLYTISDLIVFWHTGNEPMTLTTAWFSFVTVELVNLASIKRKEVTKDEIS